MAMRNNNGFLLLEILVALFFLLASMTVITSYQVNTLLWQKTSIRYLEAIAVVHDTLEQCKITGKAPTWREKTYQDAITVTWRTEQYTLPQPTGVPTVNTTTGMERIWVTGSWKDNVIIQRSVTLSGAYTAGSGS